MSHLCAKIFTSLISLLLLSLLKSCFDKSISDYEKIYIFCEAICIIGITIHIWINPEVYIPDESNNIEEVQE